MNLNNLIAFYKNKKKEAILQKISPKCQKQYAVIGVGQHSLATFYPLFSYLNIPIRYILTKKSGFGNDLAIKFPEAKATNNYEDILQDPLIDGIFICSQPSTHFELIKKALSHNKFVFTEKPPCFSTAELQELIKIGEQNCLVGLQKRFSPLTQIIKNQYAHPLFYQSRYALGSYPEGNPIYDLFIHPVDNLLFLFGPAKIAHIRKVKNKDSIVFIIYLLHDSGVEGILELSTNHNWNDPIDTLRLEMQSEEVFINYPNFISTTSKEKKIFGLSINKAFRQPVTKRIIYQNKGILNTLENNVLYEAGYFQEVKAFVSLVEDATEKRNVNHSNLQSMIDTYSILDLINSY